MLSSLILSRSRDGGEDQEEELETSRAQELVIILALCAQKFMSLGHSQSNIDWGFYSFIHIPPFQILYPNFTIWHWFQYLIMFFEPVFQILKLFYKMSFILFRIKKTTANDWIVVRKYAFKILIFLLSQSSAMWRSGYILGTKTVLYLNPGKDMDHFVVLDQLNICSGLQLFNW